MKYENRTYFIEKAPDFLIKNKKQFNAKTVVDIGCGDGTLIYALSKENFFEKNSEIIAIDNSSKRLERTKKLNPKVKTIKSDACKLKLKNNSISFVISTQVIEHVDDKKMLKEIYRILKKNEYCYISTVFKKKWAWYFYRNKGKWVIDPTHIREYTDNQLVDLIKKTGFKILKQKKSKIRYPIIDPLLRIIKSHKRFNTLRKLKIVIPGYYNWEFIIQK